MKQAEFDTNLSRRWLGLAVGSLILAGVLALVLSGVTRIWRRLRRSAEPAEPTAPVSERVFAATPSVPPPSL